MIIFFIYITSFLKISKITNTSHSNSRLTHVRFIQKEKFSQLLYSRENTRCLEILPSSLQRNRFLQIINYVAVSCGYNGITIKNSNKLIDLFSYSMKIRIYLFRIVFRATSFQDEQRQIPPLYLHYTCRLQFTGAACAIYAVWENARCTFLW